MESTRRLGFDGVHGVRRRKSAEPLLHLGKWSRNPAPFFTWVSSPGRGVARRASILIHLALPLQQARWSLRRDGAAGAPVLDHHTRGRPGISLMQKNVRSAGMKIYPALPPSVGYRVLPLPLSFFNPVQAPPPAPIDWEPIEPFVSGKPSGVEEKPLSVCLLSRSERL